MPTPALTTPTTPRKVEVIPLCMTPGESALLEQWLGRAKTFLEFGMGVSTERALARENISRIDSVESSREYAYDIMLAKTPIRAAADDGRLRVHYVDIGDTGAMGYPIGSEGVKRWENYAGIVHTLEANWDTVLVDGRFRVACVLNLLLLPLPDLVILVHDFWDREHYHAVLDFVEVLDRADTLGVFRRKHDCDPGAVRALLRRYARDAR